MVDTSRGYSRGGEHPPPPEENTDVPDFTLDRLHLLL